jgi:hypothetical protein
MTTERRIGKGLEFREGSLRQLILSTAIRSSTEGIGFPAYSRFLDDVLRGDEGRNGSHPLTGNVGYPALRHATDRFLRVHMGVPPGEHDLERIEADLMGQVSSERPPTNASADTVAAAWNAHTARASGMQLLPYLELLRDKLASDQAGTDNESAVNGRSPLLKDQLRATCLAELIWSYWQEEGMLVQSLDAIARRCQSGRIGSDSGPLANLDIHPLRPLDRLLSAYAQDDLSRRSAARRAYEYEHHYGLKLTRRALPATQPTAHRSTFVAAFHHLLRQSHVFNARDEQRTVLADALPVLNALQEVHLLLAEGAHNQFGDLPSASRAEMLMAQWLLARPEMHEFLGVRTLVPYPEPWMDRVDTMKELQGWSAGGVIHFNDLATFGEQILLGIRFDSWNSIADPAPAANFARIWRAEIQGYVHAYRAVTGVDLAAR